MLLRLLGQNKPHRAAGFAQQLAVKQVGRYRLFNRHRAGRHHHRRKSGHQSGQPVQQLWLIDKRFLMTKQHLLIAHRNDIVMKNAFIDNRRVLPGEDDLPGIHLIEPRDGLAGLQRLARRIARRQSVSSLLAAIDKQLQTGRTVLAAEAVMVRRAFVAKQRHLRKRRMYGKPPFIRENGAQ